MKWQDERSFDCVPTAPTEARAFVVDSIRRHAGTGPGPDPADAALVVSELVANAIRAASPTVGVRLVADRDHLEIRVSDQAAGRPIPRTPDPTEPSGRGLMLVAALASEWGVTDIARQGKEVWARLAVRPQSA
jgi:anti-sigma regulatory factor (Ser/Thr protein kinase)